MTDAELYGRGVDTLLASWAAYADGSDGAGLERRAGVICAVFPADPERGVYNNAILERAAAVDAMESVYAQAGVERFAAWVHETDEATRSELQRRGYVLDTTTRAMGMALDDIPLPRPELDLVSPEWEVYLQTFGMPAGLLSRADRSVFEILVAQSGGALVATAMAFDHGSDCGIYNVGTVEQARRRGFGTALTALHLHNAVGRGCETATLQATPMAERMYAAGGFRDLGRFLEFVRQPL